MADKTRLNGALVIKLPAVGLLEETVSESDEFRSLLDLDKWSRSDLDFLSNGASAYTPPSFDFTKISQVWLRNSVKAYIYNNFWGLNFGGTGTAATTEKDKFANLLDFSRFLQIRCPKISAKEITPQHLKQYLEDMSKRSKPVSERQQTVRIKVLDRFIECARSSPDEGDGLYLPFAADVTFRRGSRGLAGGRRSVKTELSNARFATEAEVDAHLSPELLESLAPFTEEAGFTVRLVLMLLCEGLRVSSIVMMPRRRPDGRPLLLSKGSGAEGELPGWVLFWLNSKGCRERQLHCIFGGAPSSLKPGEIPPLYETLTRHEKWLEANCSETEWLFPKLADGVDYVERATVADRRAFDDQIVDLLITQRCSRTATARKLKISAYKLRAIIARIEVERGISLGADRWDEQILALLEEGCSKAEVGQRLGLSIYLVDPACARLSKKNRLQATQGFPRANRSRDAQVIDCRARGLTQVQTADVMHLSVGQVGHITRRLIREGKLESRAGNWRPNRSFDDEIVRLLLDEKMCPAHIAKQLDMRHSTLWQKISRIEQERGIKLTSRRPNGVKHIPVSAASLILGSIHLAAGWNENPVNPDYKSRINPHAFRHWYVTALIEMGYPDQFVMQQVDHLSPAMLQQYLHLSPSYFRKQQEKATRFTTDGTKLAEIDLSDPAKAANFEAWAAVSRRETNNCGLPIFEDCQIVPRNGCHDCPYKVLMPANLEDILRGISWLEKEILDFEGKLAEAQAKNHPMAAGHCDKQISERQAHLASLKNDRDILERDRQDGLAITYVNANPISPNGAGQQ